MKLPFAQAQTTYDSWREALYAALNLGLQIHFVIGLFVAAYEHDERCNLKC